MNKYSFLSFIAATAVFAICSCSGKNVGSSEQQSFNAIESGFKQPDSMKLAVFWYWISDNISKEGVIRDLEAMKKAGINRAFIGNIGLDGPDTPYGKIKLFTPEWWEITHTALKKATELDIEIGIFNSPGWSLSGGPWVKPEQSMRYLASSEITLKGPQKAANIKLPQVAEDAMGDVRIIAYAALPAMKYAFSVENWKQKNKEQ
jgi:hypothetical protein